MKNKIWFVVISGLLLITCVFIYSQNTNAKKREIWEYKTLNGSIRNETNSVQVLNKYGEEGWELVAIEPKSDDSLVPIYIFKRKKE